MEIEQDVLHELEVSWIDEIALELKKTLHGLNQVGRLWSEFLHKKLTDLGFMQCLTDMCVYRKRLEKNIKVVGVYADDVLVTALKGKDFSVSWRTYRLRILGEVKKFLGMRIIHSDDSGYDIEQKVTIQEMRKENGLEDARDVRT